MPLLRVAAVLLIVGLPLAAQPAPALSQAPALGLRDLNGATQSLAALRGRIVVVNFWATWCVPCKEEMPLLSGVAADYAPRGVTVIGANTDAAETAGNVPKFLKRTRVGFPVWMGATTDDMQRFGLGAALPATAILDRDGAVVFRILGPVTAAEVRERLDYLLRAGDGAAQDQHKGTEPAALVDNLAKALREHEEETGHRHGSVALEGASSVPS